MGCSSSVPSRPAWLPTHLFGAWSTERGVLDSKLAWPAGRQKQMPLRLLIGEEE